MTIKMKSPTNQIDNLHQPFQKQVPVDYQVQNPIAVIVQLMYIIKNVCLGHLLKVKIK